MSHGVTANTAGLNYSGESGGLNEATSDIFGTGVEFYANNSSDVGDYLIGEKININGDGTPLRYMDKPSKDGGSKDSWSSTVGNLDVHYSSGVANHFFYLLSEGSGAKTINGVSYNSPTSNGSTVTGIGRAKALQIWYKALTTYFTSTTKYAGARTGTLSAAAAASTAPAPPSTTRWRRPGRRSTSTDAGRVDTLGARAVPGAKASPGTALLLGSMSFTYDDVGATRERGFCPRVSIPCMCAHVSARARRSSAGPPKRS